MIPTPSPSRLLWGAGWNQQPVVAGPRYEDHSPQISTPAASKKGRGISKDMVSKLTGFVCVYCCGRALSVHSLTLFIHLVHASGAVKTWFLNLLDSCAFIAVGGLYQCTA